MRDDVEVRSNRPRKRARADNSISSHLTIARLLQTLIGHQYCNQNHQALSKIFGWQHAKFNNFNDKYHSATSHDLEFLENELKGFLGTKGLCFQMEEESVILAFNMAFDAIIERQNSMDAHQWSHNAPGSTPYDLAKSAIAEADRSIIGKRQQIARSTFKSSLGQNLASTGSNEIVINTALEIIDSFVARNREERNTRILLNKSKKNYQSLPSPYSHNRRNFHMLLMRQIDSRVKVDNNPKSSKVVSIIEEGHPEKWEWLCRFRKVYRAKKLSREELVPDNGTASEVDAKENTECRTSNDDSQVAPNNERKNKNGFVVLQPKIIAIDELDISSDDESNIDKKVRIEGENNIGDALVSGTNGTDTVKEAGKLPIDSGVNHVDAGPETTMVSETSAAAGPALPSTDEVQRNKLDKEALELRLSLLDVPPGKRSSEQAVRYATEAIGKLLSMYGDLDGAAGVTRCGEIIAGSSIKEFLRGGDCSIKDNGADVDSNDATLDNDDSKSGIFPVNDAIALSLVKSYLTDATSALRAKAFLRSFILPLLIQMNPTLQAHIIGENASNDGKSKNEGKPASRQMASLLTFLARCRPMDCVESMVIPALVVGKIDFEPTRFQCDLFSRTLRGKDALSIEAVALLVDQLVPANKNSHLDSATGKSGMKWTEHSMPLLTACLNRKPPLASDLISRLADTILHYTTPKAANKRGGTSHSMEKSMKFSTLFHTLVSNFGHQLKLCGKVDSLEDAADGLKTFMSKTICASLKKLKN